MLSLIHISGMRGKIVVQRGLKRFHRQAGQHAGNARRDKFRLCIAPADSSSAEVSPAVSTAESGLGSDCLLYTSRCV